MTTAKIADANVTTAKIASGGNSKVLVTDNIGNVAWINRTDFAGISDNSSLEGDGTTANPYRVKDLGVVTAKLAANAVTNAKIADNAITTTKIQDGQVTNTKLVNFTVNNVITNANAADISVNASTALGATTTINIPNASSTQRGALTAADWNTFNSKLGTNLPSANVWVGNASATASPVSVSGDISINNTGAVTIANNAVTTLKIQDGQVTNVKLANSSVGQTLGTAGTDLNYSSPTTALGSSTTLNVPNASATSRGALTSADWITFNNKLSTNLPSANIFVGNASANAAPVVMSGDATLSNTGALTVTAQYPTLKSQIMQ